MNAYQSISLADALGRLAVFAASALFACIWLINVALPLLIGVPMSWAAAPLLAVSAPAFFLIGFGWWFAHRS